MRKNSTQPKFMKKKKEEENKLTNPYISLITTLCKEGYNQSEIDLLFNTIVLPNINYALSVYAASESDLTPVQCFLDRCFKRKYTSKPVSVYDFLERQDRKIFRKVSNARDRAEGGAGGALAPPLFCKKKNKFNKK